jgi:hypothetical protein
MYALLFELNTGGKRTFVNLIRASGARGTHANPRDIESGRSRKK